jgi:hypothetical protein
MAPATVTRAAAVLAGIALAALAGCGHPATHAECEEILRRAAEVELLQQKTPPDKIAARVEEAAQARGSELTAKCVGKRITNDAMACMRKAQTPDQLEGCLD